MIRDRLADSSQFPAGYSDRDGTVEFFGRIQALLPPNGIVLDFGCGRGKWQEDPCVYRRRLQDLRAPGRLVVGVDVDTAMVENSGLDARILSGRSCALPVRSGSVDLVVADWVLEHLDESTAFAREVGRVLRPGGWLCARTPNRWGYVGVAARAVPDAWHRTVLRKVQPDRCPKDMFPTRYRMNTLNAIATIFPSGDWENGTYTFDPDIDYVGSARWLRRALTLWQRVSPRALGTDLFVFLQRSGTAQG